MTANAAPDAVPEECWTMEEFMDPFSSCASNFADWNVYCSPTEKPEECVEYGGRIVKDIFGISFDFMAKTMTANAAPDAVPDTCWTIEQIYDPDTTCDPSFEAWETYCSSVGALDLEGCADYWNTLINVVFGLELDPELKKMLAKRVSLMGKT